MRRTTSVDFVTHTESGPDDQSFLGNSPSYLTSISRISRNEFNGKQRSNWGPADTYGHTRRIPNPDRYNGRNR